MIKPDHENYLPLQKLFQSEPDLFTAINPKLRKWEDAPELLYCDGEADLIEIGNKFYRFFWESVEEFGIED